MRARARATWHVACALAVAAVGGSCCHLMQASEARTMVGERMMPADMHW